MAYAIVQKELVVPDLERLKRAFIVSPLLTDLDAQTAVNDAYGILLRGLDITQAKTLQQALLMEGIETELVEEAKLPTIPPPKVARQAEFLESHLTVYDSLRRPSEISWKDLMFIAAGYVRTRDGRRRTNGGDETQSTNSGKGKSEGHYQMLVEIFLNGGAGRCSITADEFTFDCLGAGQTDDPAMNFVFLVQELARHAPHAGLNRGAYLACQRPPELFPYPSKAAFHEEITWMLWRIARMPVAEEARV